jgi:hypothetical protein
MFRGAITLKVAIGTSAIWGLTAGAASGATRYVSTHGNDGPTCGRSSAASTGATGPCKTLGGAVTVAKSGDKIKLAPGTYADTNVTIASRSSWSARAAS